MATVSFTVPDSKVERLQNGFAKQNDYQEMIQDPDFPAEEILISNPESKGQFLKRKTKEYWKNSVIAAETADAIEAARKSIDPNVL